MNVHEALTFLGDDKIAPLTTQFEVASDGLHRRKRQRPINCSTRLFGAATDIQIIARSEGSCFFFHTLLGHLPFTAQAGPEARQMLNDLLRRLGKEMEFITSDVDVTLDKSGRVHVRGSLVTDTQPTVATLLTAVAEYAQAARPFLLELRPLLAH